MAETPDSIAGSNPQISDNDPFPGVAQDSSADFWYDIYAKNQDGSSSRDYEWGYVFEKSRELKRKRKKYVVSSSAVQSGSDLSEALSAVSAALSLSSSSHGSAQRDREHLEEDIKWFSNLDLKWLSNVNEISEGPPSVVENLYAEKTDNTTKSYSSFDIQSLSSESDWDDLVSSYKNSGVGVAQSNISVNEVLQKGEFQVPELGMIFSSEEAAYKCYETYANRTGFRVRKGKVQRLSDGTIRKRYFFCSRQGFRSEKQSSKMTKYRRKETRTGCDAKIQFTFENGKWVVSQFSHEHNHQLGTQRHTIEPCTKTWNGDAMFCSKNEAGVTLKRLENVTDMEIPDPIRRKDNEVLQECEHSVCNQPSKKVRKDELGEKLGTSSLLLEETDEVVAPSCLNGMETERASLDEESGSTRKRTRLSKEQSAFIEQIFKELHNQLDHKQKLTSANNEADMAFQRLEDVTDTEIPVPLRGKDDEVDQECEYGVCYQSSQRVTKDELGEKLGTSSLSAEEADDGAELSLPNRRARKDQWGQTEEVDCELLNICGEILIEENRRLRKDLQRVLQNFKILCMQLHDSLS